MGIPWRSIATKGWHLLVQVIRATAPKEQETETPPTTDDRWREFTDHSA